MKSKKRYNFFDLGFVIPVEAEAKPLIEILQKRKDFQYGQRKVTIGYINNKKVCIIISGCGKIKSASATQLLIDEYPAKLYIHYGTAGAISDKLKIGDVIIASEVIEHDVIELFPDYVPPPVHVIDNKLIKTLDDLNGNQIIVGRILSGDEDIIKYNRKVELATLYKGLSVDWESAGFALTSKINQVRFLILRAVSDLADERTSKLYLQNQDFAVKNVVDLILDKILVNDLIC